MPTGTGMKHLEKAMPDQASIDVSIAEEHGVILRRRRWRRWAIIPSWRSAFLHSSSVAYDCIHHDVCLQDLPVIFCMDAQSFFPANDGPTHHGLFDISYLRCLPEHHRHGAGERGRTFDMMFTATHQNHPTFIRYPRGTAEGMPVKDQPQLLEIGKAQSRPEFCHQREKAAWRRRRCSGSGR